MIHIQRSCGYSSVRKTIDVAEIGRICQVARKLILMLSALLITVMANLSKNKNLLK